MPTLRAFAAPAATQTLYLLANIKCIINTLDGKNSFAEVSKNLTT